MNEKNIEPQTALVKGLGEWGLAAGRFYQSSQTGFVHLYQGEKEQQAQTIPLLENVLFVLALFRSRTIEQVQEAKKLLRHLLAFQNKHASESEGNFPIYQHEFPVCRDYAIALQMLAPMYWILKHFGHVLGAELKHQLEEAARLALSFSLNLHQEVPFSYPLSVRLFAAQWTLGILWEKEPMQYEGKNELELLSQQQLEGWNTTRHLADILIGLQMVYPVISKSPWAPLWQTINQTWHSALASYAGPCVREWQEGSEPQVNLYDLFGGYFSGKFSDRAARLNPMHLFGLLIQPSSERFTEMAYPFKVEGIIRNQRWILKGYSDFACMLLEKKGPFQPTVDKTHTSFRFMWGDLHGLHSLVCQGGNVETIQFSEMENTVLMDFELREWPIEEQGMPKSEIEFFVDYQPGVNFRFNGVAASTFALDQEIELNLVEHQMLISFQLIDGEGDFIGHIMRGNRPSQISLKGDKRFHSYDWTFFLRTIRRKNKCKIRATITLPIAKDV